MMDGGVWVHVLDDGLLSCAYLRADIVQTNVALCRLAKIR